MKCNIGKTDKIIRIILGIVIILIGVIIGSWWGLVGLLPLLTGLFGYCACYGIFGISTNKTSEQ